MTKAGIILAGDMYEWFDTTIYYFHVPLFFFLPVTLTFCEMKIMTAGLAVAIVQNSDFDCGGRTYSVSTVLSNEIWFS